MPEAIRTVLLQALALKPADRPQTAAAFRDALAAAFTSIDAQAVRA